MMLLIQLQNSLAMHSCKCPKSENGCYQWKCVAGKCSKCKLIKPMPFECASSEQKIKISQFEVTETPYKKTVDGKEVDKIKKKKQQQKNKTESIYTITYFSKMSF